MINLNGKSLDFDFELRTLKSDLNKYWQERERERGKKNLELGEGNHVND